MSNEPPSKRLLARPSPASEPAAAAGSDADRVLAAFERIEAAARDGRKADPRLQHDLGELATAVGHLRSGLDAKGVLDDELVVLLRDLEIRIELITVLASRDTAAPACVAAAAVPARPSSEPEQRTAEEQALLDALRGHDDAAAPTSAPEESDHVPTVSEVVSQLGRANDPDAAATSEAVAPASTGPATTVAMLEAMVEELAASMPITAASESPIAEPQDTEPSPPRAALSEPDVFPLPSVAAATGPSMPEIELLSSYARMEAVPYLPPEVGRAVIFEPREFKSTAEPPAIDAQADLTPIEALASPVPAPPDEARADPSPAEAAAPSARVAPIVIMPPADPSEPDDGAATAAVGPDAPQPFVPHAIEAPANDLDRDALLFGPVPDAEPDPAAAFLLDHNPLIVAAEPAEPVESDEPVAQTEAVSPEPVIWEQPAMQVSSPIEPPAPAPAEQPDPAPAEIPAAVAPAPEPPAPRPVLLARNAAARRSARAAEGDER